MSSNTELLYSSLSTSVMPIGVAISSVCHQQASLSGKKPFLLIDDKKPENSPNLTPLKAKVKNKLFEKNVETSKAKGSEQTIKSSSNEKNQLLKNTESSDTKKERNEEKTIRKELFEKIKKYKSLDVVKKVESRNLSKTALTKQVSDAFQRGRNEKSTSEVEFVREISKPVNENKSFLTAVLDKYSTDLNLFGRCRNFQPGTLNNGQSAAGKSLSFDSLRHSISPRHLPKSPSVENRKNKTSERPIGVFNLSKRSYTQTLDPSRRRNLTESLCSKPFNRKKIFTPQKIFADANKLYQKNSSDNLLEYPNYCVNLNEESNFQDSSLEYLLKTNPCTRAVDSAKKQNEQTCKDHPLEKKTVEICQCLHFHTEDGIKKMCIQNSPKTKELGKKFFRVNYFSKGHEEGEEETGSKVELVDTGTDPDPTGEQEKASTSKINKKQPRSKVPSKNSVHSNGRTKVRVKEEKSIPKGKKEEEAANFVLVQDGDKMQVLEQPALPEKEESTSQRTLEGTKFKKRATPTKKGQKNSSKPRSAAKDKDEKENFKEMDLLENLEKLFVRLNSAENLRIRGKKSKIRPADKLDKNENKYRDTVQNVCSAQLLRDLEEEEEFLRRRKKLRNAIIRQLRNWLEVSASEK